MSSTPQNVRVVGRYALYQAIAAGGMATVHFGRLLGPVGFSRTVAIKRLHAQFAADPEFVSMFLDEARLAARIRHPNVVPTLDVVATGGELFLVMEYVPGESVARLARAMRERRQTIPLRILSAIMAGVLHGLHAAHEAKDERGHPLGIVHRDVSPQNVLVGTDGVPRVLDFGVAKAAGRVQTTKEGQIKGKLAYMPPEQLKGAAVSRQTDIYAAGVMLWELLTGQRLFTGDNEGAVVAKVLDGRVEAPSLALMRAVGAPLADSAVRLLTELDATVLRALHMQPEARFATAREMALEIERKCPPATASEVGDWVESVARDVLSSRAAMIAEIESSTSLAPAEPRDGHVLTVLQGRETVTPGVPPPPTSSDRQNQTRLASPQALGKTMPLGAPPPSYAPLVDGPPMTQPSSISVSAASRGPFEQGTGKKTAAAAAIGILLGLGVLATAVVYKRSVERTAATAEPPATAVPVVTPEPTPETAPEPPASAPPSSSEAAASASAPEEQKPPPPTHAAKPAVPKPRPTAAPKPKEPTPPPPPPTAAPVDDCQPPYWYDSQGVKKYKPQCLGK